jgi:hypothetical protein
MIKLQQAFDAMGNPVIAGIPQSDTIYPVALLANQAQYITPPSWAGFVLFGMPVAGGLDLWVLLFPTPVLSGLVIPGATTTENPGTYQIPELNPLLRAIGNMKTIGLISPGAPTLTLAFYG